jgi:hypothetical protein
VDDREFAERYAAAKAAVAREQAEVRQADALPRRPDAAGAIVGVPGGGLAAGVNRRLQM